MIPLKNVVSVFDGMSCGQIALNLSNISYQNYFASEIEEPSIKVTKHNYPNTIHIGDVTLVNGKDYKDVDLFMGGSPCQSFSKAGDGSGFDGKSKLFWEFVRLKEELNPKYFLLENVQMKKEWEDVITKAMGVEPIMIPSSLFVPQARKRLYWTNIPVTLPKQKEYNVYDFIETEGFPTSCTKKERYFTRKDIFGTLTASYCKGIRGDGRPAVSIRESKLDEDRSAHRMLTPTECEKIQGVPVGYTSCVANTNRYKMLGNGWTVPVIQHIFEGLKKPLANKSIF